MFRMNPDVSSLIPEINSDDVKLHHGIIANQIAPLPIA